MSVLGTGHCTLDHFGIVDRFPEPGKETEMNAFSVQGGGTAATAVVVVARWGGQARFFGKVGDDARADAIERTLSGEGVDTTFLVREPGAVSQFRFVALERGTGDHRTLFSRGNTTALTPAEASDVRVDSSDLLVLDGLEPAAQITLAKRANEIGAPVLLDAHHLGSDHSELVERADYLVASERFASRWTGLGELDGATRALLEAGPDTVVLTLGDEGAVGAVEAEENLLWCSAYPVDMVEDTGSGDIFLGAFAYGVARGWPLERQIRVANLAAGLSCAHIGSRGSIPALKTVEDRLRDEP